MELGSTANIILTTSYPSSFYLSSPIAASHNLEPDNREMIRTLLLLANAVSIDIASNEVLRCASEL